MVTNNVSTQWTGLQDVRNLLAAAQAKTAGKEESMHMKHGDSPHRAYCSLTCTSCEQIEVERCEATRMFAFLAGPAASAGHPLLDLDQNPHHYFDKSLLMGV